MTIISQFFDIVQTFYVDKNLVQNASQVRISSVGLYFKNKPFAENNSSGIVNPGVTIYIAETNFGVPKILYGYDYPISRVEYVDITASSDSSVETKFRFSKPITLDTDKEYAIVIGFDGNSEYVLWTSKQGDYITGTTNISPGPSGKYVGNYYEKLSRTIDTDNFNEQTDYNSSWTPLSDKDLKFNVYVARYTINGVSVDSDPNAIPNISTVISGSTTNSQSYTISSPKTEFFTFDQSISSKASLVGAQLTFQNTFSYPGGKFGNTTAHKVSVTANENRIVAGNTLPNGAAFSWSNIYSDLNSRKSITLKSGNNYNIRAIKNILSNTVIEVQENITFTNSTCEFLITPAGRIKSFNRSAPFGDFTSILHLASSTANSTVRFVNNVIESTAITIPGNGYSNSNVLYVRGFENVPGKVEGGYQAIANIETNSNGNIVLLHFSNNGCGFVNSSEMSVVITATANSSAVANTSNGSGASFAFTTGCTLRTELAQNIFANCALVNFELSELIPFFEIDNPPGTNYSLKLSSQYFSLYDANTFSKKAYYVSNDQTLFDLKMNNYNLLFTDKVPVFISASNEYITKYSNGAVNDKVSNLVDYTDNIRLFISHTSNNDFMAVTINNSPRAVITKYIVNDIFDGEETDQGSAWAKGISRKITFQREAEDCIIYLNAYKPANTDVQVYVRFWNNFDPEAFDDKTWTILNLTSGKNLVSSTSKKDDYVELTYGVKQYPKVQYTIAGTVTTTSNSATVTGVGTTFSANLAVGDLIRIYSPLFPENHIVTTVETITSNTSLVIDDPITNNSIISTGLYIDKILNKKEAYRNIQNKNVMRYYNSNGMKFDGYDVLQVKIVLLSDSPNLIPRIDDMRGVGVTA